MIYFTTYVMIIILLCHWTVVYIINIVKWCLVKNSLKDSIQMVAWKKSL